MLKKVQKEAGAINFAREVEDFIVEAGISEIDVMIEPVSGTLCRVTATRDNHPGCRPRRLDVSHRVVGYRRQSKDGWRSTSPVWGWQVRQVVGNDDSVHGTLEAGVRWLLA